jgi:hypothetical protein
MNIEFIAITDEAKYFYDPPSPSKKFIPEWYKNMPKTINNERYQISDSVYSVVNGTLKMCTPFLDGMTTGYMWSAPVDIEVKKQLDGNYFFKWRTEEPIITEHTKDQHPGLPRAFYGQDFVMKWAFNYIIKTPKGYSTYFTHPINRYDLPFVTLSGVVDTDKYKRPVQFPFQIVSKDEYFIIEKGTPLCQFFPIKRESWKSTFSEMSEIESRKTNFDFKSKIQRAYKNRFWEKKIYE